MFGLSESVMSPSERARISALNIASIAALKAVAVTGLPDKIQALVGGYYAHGDGGGGVFFYDAGASDADNGGTIVAPTAGGGRWLRAYSSAINVRWFGAKGDDSTNDTAAIQSAINVGGIVYVPAGIYRTAVPLRLPTGVSLIGESLATTTLKKTTTTADNLGDVASPLGGGAVNDNYNVDSVISVVHGAGDFSRANRIERLTIERTTLGSSSYGIFAPRIAYARIIDVYITRATYGIRSFTLFLSCIEDCVAKACANGFVLDNDGSNLGGSTSLRLQRFYCDFDNTVVEPVNGISLYGLSYSNLISCAVDKSIRTDATAPRAYYLTLCNGVHLTGCGSEQTKGIVIQCQSSKSVTVTGMSAAPILGATFTGTVAVRFLDNSNVTFAGCTWAAISDPGNIYNNVITNGSHITDINEGTAISAGNVFVSYGSSSTWSRLVNGKWITQASSTAKTAIYSASTPTQVVLAAGSASVASAGLIATGVSGGLDDKFVIVQVRRDDAAIPTVAAHVTETYSGSDSIKVAFTKLSDGTIDYGTFTVNWMVLANV